MKKIIMILSLALSLSSCRKQCEDVDGYLTEDEKSWLSYSGGETLIFKSNSNAIDTLVVGDKISLYNIGYSESEDPCEHHQHEVKFEIFDQPVYFTLHVSHNNSWVDGGAAINYLQFKDFPPQNDILINGNLFDNVYIMSDDTSNFTGSQQTVWRTYYTKQSGIIRYELTQGGGFWEKIN